MGGPILIYDMASRTEEHGWPFFFNLMAWLSISLGVINLFPIPILDGGHLFFFAIEAVTRREVPIKVRQVAAYFGLACILALMVTVFWNDIARNWGTISNWF
jgi:regulator of sigma E protease